MERIKCANAQIEESIEFKPIICNVTKRKCVCASCLHPREGFKMNPWAKNCPGFKERTCT